MKTLRLFTMLMVILNLAVAFCCFGVAPSWTSGYPEIVHGASSVDLNVKTDEDGTVYYGIYSAVQSGLTAAQLKSDVINGNTALVRMGTIAIAADTALMIQEVDLPDDSTYHIYIVAESESGLMADADLYYSAITLPPRLSGFTDYIDSKISGYTVYFPEDYFRNDADYPLLVFLHGVGEYSYTFDYDKLVGTGLPEVILNGKEIPMIVVCPQSKYASLNGAYSQINSMIAYLQTKYRIDEDLLFFTGLSSGGDAVLNYANAVPENVKALVPVSTGFSESIYDYDNFTGFPIWGFNGDADGIDLYNALQEIEALGGDVTYTAYPGAHADTVWNAVYDGRFGDDIYAWMLSFADSSANVPPMVSAGSDTTVTLPLSQLVLTGTATDTDGSVATVQWLQVSGPTVTLAGDTTYQVTLTDLLPGSYVFSFTATDDDGATAADVVTVTVNETATVDIYINLTWPTNVQNDSIWNDLIAANGSPAGTSLALLDEAGQATGITISIESVFATSAKNNHGVVPGLFPDDVMRYFYRSTQTVQGALKLSGLDTTKQYDLSILCSTYDTYYPADTEITINGGSQEIDASQNSTTLLDFTDLSPDSNGEMTIDVAPATTETDNEGMINAIVLSEHDITSASTARMAYQVISSEGTRGAAVQFFPNPVPEYVTVAIPPEAATATYRLQVYNLRGSSMLQYQLEHVSGQQTLQKIYAGFMNAGLYIVELQNESSVQRYKIIKQ